MNEMKITDIDEDKHRARNEHTRLEDESKYDIKRESEDAGSGGLTSNGRIGTFRHPKRDAAGLAWAS